MINLKETTVEIEKLLLDPNNPRFSKHKDERVADNKIEKVQGRAMKNMLSGGFGVDELSENIKKNGYLGFDRIFVKKNDGHYIVVEGNRRISAVKNLIALSQGGEKKHELRKEVLNSFKTIPAIDVTDLSEEEIRFMLGRRHFDSVKDWKPLPQAYHLFTTYLEYQLGHSEEDADELADKYIHDAGITKTISELYDLPSTSVKNLVQTYRLYLQISEHSPDVADQANIFSLITEIISTPKLRIKWEFDVQLATLTTGGLEQFISMCTGSDPVIAEIAKGDRSLRDYVKILKDGDEEDASRIEIEHEEASVVAAEIKTRKKSQGVKQMLSKMAKDLEQLKLGNINPEEVTNSDADMIKRLIEELKKLLGSVGK